MNARTAPTFVFESFQATGQCREDLHEKYFQKVLKETKLHKLVLDNIGAAIDARYLTSSQSERCASSNWVNCQIWVFRLVLWDLG